MVIGCGGRRRFTSGAGIDGRRCGIVQNHRFVKSISQNTFRGRGWSHEALATAVALFPSRLLFFRRTIHGHVQVHVSWRQSRTLETVDGSRVGGSHRTADGREKMSTLFHTFTHFSHADNFFHGGSQDRAGIEIDWATRTAVQPFQ